MLFKVNSKNCSNFSKYCFEDEVRNGFNERSFSCDNINCTDLVANNHALCTGPSSYKRDSQALISAKASSLTNSGNDNSIGSAVEIKRTQYKGRSFAGLFLTKDGIKIDKNNIAFPKVSNSSELMSGAPAEVDNAQLKELSISIDG